MQRGKQRPAFECGWKAALCGTPKPFHKKKKTGNKPFNSSASNTLPSVYQPAKCVTVLSRQKANSVGVWWREAEKNPWLFASSSLFLVTNMEQTANNSPKGAPRSLCQGVSVSVVWQKFTITY